MLKWNGENTFATISHNQWIIQFEVDEHDPGEYSLHTSITDTSWTLVSARKFKFSSPKLAMRFAEENLPILIQHLETIKSLGHQMERLMGE